jgi:hypothetical protein
MRLVWLVFALFIVLGIALPKLVQSQEQTAVLCNDCICVMLESQLRDFLQHLRNLQKLLDERRCL